MEEKSAKSQVASPTALMKAFQIFRMILQLICWEKWAKKKLIQQSQLLGDNTYRSPTLHLKKKTVHLDVGHSQSGIVSFCCNHDIARASHVPIISKLSKLPQLHHNFWPADALGVKLTMRPSFVRPEMLGFTTKELEEAGTWKRKV